MEYSWLIRDGVDRERMLDMDRRLVPVRRRSLIVLGLALIASEPRQFTIVNIVGAIDLDKLHKLEGQFGVPKLDLDPAKPPVPGRK